MYSKGAERRSFSVIHVTISTSTENLIYPERHLKSIPNPIRPTPHPQTPCTFTRTHTQHQRHICHTSHDPHASPFSLFQGDHGKSPETAGLHRTWAWPNSFPWLWTWDHQLLMFWVCFSFPFHHGSFSFAVLYIFTSFSPPSLCLCINAWHSSVFRWPQFVTWLFLRTSPGRLWSAELKVVVRMPRFFLAVRVGWK